MVGYDSLGAHIEEGARLGGIVDRGNRDVGAGTQGPAKVVYRHIRRVQVKGAIADPAPLTGEAILSETAALGADLLVKGAYTHGRFRQLIFGGATRHIIHHAELPVLMAH